MDFKEAQEEFLTAGRQRGWRPGTVSSYRWHLNRLHGWLRQDGDDALSSLDAHRIRQWGAQIHDSWALTTTRGAVAAAKGFLRWLLDEKVIEEDLAAVLRMPKIPEKEQRTISVSEVRRILWACSVPLDDAHDPDQALACAVRNVALVSVLFDSMIRASELCNLQLKDLDLQRGMLRIRKGKGGKGRSAPIGPDAVLALRVWLQLRRPARDVDSLFVSVGGLTPGRALTTSGLRLILRRIGERCGLDGVSPHAFRRGGAVAATLRGAPSRLVQVWGGWSNIKMVELYTRTLRNDPEATLQFRRYSPLSFMPRGRKWLLGLERQGALKGVGGRRRRRLLRGCVPQRRRRFVWYGRPRLAAD